MITGDKLFLLFKQMLFQIELSMYLFRIIRIVSFSLQFIQFQYLIPGRIILFNFFGSLLSLALYVFLDLTLTVGLNRKFNKTLSIIDKLVHVANDGTIHMLKHLLFKTNYLLLIAAIGLLLCTRLYTLRTLLLILIQLLLLNIFEIKWRKNQRKISLVTSSNNNTNYVDGTILFSLLNPPPLTLPTENESYGGGIALVGLLNPPPHTPNEIESYGGGVALFILIPYITFSFVAICLFLSIYYYTLRAISLTLIQLLFVFVVNFDLVNISEIIGRKIQRETSLVNSSNNNTNCSDDSVIQNIFVLILIFILK